MTEDEFKRCLPSNIRNSFNDEIRAKLNACLENQETREVMKQNILGYTDVIQQGKFSLDEYLSAIQFVTYKAMGDTNSLAYKKVFPERYSAMVDKGYELKDINSRISGYNKSRLVTLLYEKLMIPTYILNQDVFQDALNTQREIMNNTKYSPIARVQAAKSLLDTLKPPELKKMQLDVSVNESDTIQELRKTTQELAQIQLKMLNQGANLEDILNKPIIEAEVVENS